MVIVEAQENQSSRPVKYRRLTVTGNTFIAPQSSFRVPPSSQPHTLQPGKTRGNFRETADARLTHGPITLVPSPFISRARLAGSALSVSSPRKIFPFFSRVYRAFSRYRIESFWNHYSRAGVPCSTINDTPRRVTALPGSDGGFRGEK